MAAAVKSLLSGRLAIITGGGSGIGQAVCRTLAREGASIAVVDINQESAERTAKSLPLRDGCRHSGFTADIGYKKDVDSLMESIYSQFNRVPCIAVNSAGVTRDNFLLAMEEENFDEVIRTNLKGTYLVTQAVAKSMVDNSIQHGTIVNLSSISGKAGNIGQANYAASKAGVEGLTKSCAKELGKFGIRCNAILPGFIATPMTQTVPDKVVEMMKKMIAMGRLGKPEEIADVVLFLASPQSSYITGASIQVTGGLHM